MRSMNQLGARRPLLRPLVALLPLLSALALGVGASSVARAAETADLTVSMRASPIPFILGQDTHITYQVWVSNRGPDRAQVVRVSLPIPSHTTYVRHSPGGGSCIVLATITCEYTGVEAGSQNLFALEVTVAVNGGTPPGTVVTATATVSSTTATDPITTNNSASTSTTLESPRSADLSITGSATPQSASLYDRRTLTFVVTNHGPERSFAFTVEIYVRWDHLFSWSASGDGSCYAGHFNVEGSHQFLACDFGPLDAGASRTVQVNPYPGNPYDVWAYVGRLGLADSVPPWDPVPGNNSGSASVTTVPASADISVTVVDAPDPVPAGGIITYDVTATNTGPTSTENIVVQFTPPAQTTMVSQTTVATSGFCVSGSRCYYQPGEGRRYALRVQVGAGVPAGTVLTLTTTVGSAAPDPNTTNNQVSTTTTVAGSAATPTPTPTPTAVPCPKPGACSPAPTPSPPPTPTPTPTPSGSPNPTPTPTPTPPACPKPGACPPPPGPTATPSPTPTPTATPLPGLQPMTVSGTATVGGQPAAKQTVQAVIGGVVCGQALVGPTGAYQVTVNSTTQQAGCGTNGATVTFRIGGVAASGSTTFTSGGTATVAVSR